jgi:acetyl-CoA synthetase
MGWEPIRKHLLPGSSPNVAGYNRAVREFSWEAAQAQLAGLPGGRGINIAHEAVDRHAAGPRAAVTALRCIAKTAASRS